MRAIIPQEKYTGRTGVYLVQRKGAGWPIKIGSSSNLYMRLNDLQVASPEELRVVGFIGTTGRQTMHWIERTIHDRLIAYNIRGEWFRDVSELWAVYHEFKEHGLEMAREALLRARGYVC